jgi:hypothetical protein
MRLYSYAPFRQRIALSPLIRDEQRLFAKCEAFFALSMGDLMSKDIEELARFVFRDSNHRRPSKAEIKKHRSSPAALEHAAALANTVVDLIQNAPPEDRFDLLKRTPTYDVLLALAYNSTIRVRKLAVQRERARRARKRTYRIGPDI